jgi:glycerol-3-phosphate acyltransferase PlsX
MRIAIDAMGGDYAPASIVEGALVAARHLRLGLVLVGRANAIEAELVQHRRHGVDDLRVIDTPDVIATGEAPVAALRRRPRSSVKVAMEAVARGEADAVFSAGNTGGAVVAAHLVFGMLPGIDRPALATVIPARDGAAVLLDSGATVECRPQHLLQFAAMGEVYARIALDIPRPRVGLLSIGEEETKGNDLIRDAHKLLKASRLNFVGNVEAHDLFRGLADVVVCDGFTGNIALKVSEGLVEAVEERLRDELSRTFSASVGYLLSRRAFRRFRRRVDYSEYGGAPLLGVAGPTIVGHGRSSVKAVRNAVALAARFAERDVSGQVQRQLGAAS